jgi:hypothetical protein
LSAVDNKSIVVQPAYTQATWVQIPTMEFFFVFFLLFTLIWRYALPVFLISFYLFLSMLWISLLLALGKYISKP